MAGLCTPCAANGPQYDLQIQVLPEAQRLEVSGTWRLEPRDDATPSLTFYLSPLMQGLKVQLVGSPTRIKAMTSEEEGGDLKWTLELAEPIPAGGDVTLQFSYRSEPRATPQFAVRPEGSFAGGGGELWYPQSSFGHRETGVLRYRVPPGQTVISNGTLESSATAQAQGNFVFRVRRPSKFAFASGTYTAIRREGAIPFSFYSLTPREQTVTILERCAKALNALIALFGPFPDDEFSLVEVDFPTRVLGTSEFGFIFADSSQLDKEFDLSYWAHEFGHQWWGVSIRSASGTPGRMMLSEGLAAFGALRAIETIEGAAAAREFRRKGFDSYFRQVSDKKDLALAGVVPTTQDEILSMHRLANSKGFLALDLLAQRIGYERFSILLREFHTRHAGRTVAWKDFRQAIEAGTSEEIDWFFEQWFHRTGAPRYQLTWRQDGSTVKGTITQAAPSVRATLEITLRGCQQEIGQSVEIIGESMDFAWSVPCRRIESVVLDPQYRVLRWTPERDSLHPPENTPN